METASEDFQSSDLQFRKGDVLEVLSDWVPDLGPGWGVGRLYGSSQVGFFPTNYCARGTWGWPGWPKTAPEPELEPEPVSTSSSLSDLTSTSSDSTASSSMSDLTELELESTQMVAPLQ
jgi:hypothetical protein